MISKIRHFASLILCVMLLAMSISCASTDPEEAEDAALSADRPGQQDESTEATTPSADAAAESDFAAEGSQPTAESTPPSDESAVPPVPDQTASDKTSEAVAAETTQDVQPGGEASAESSDPFSGQESLNPATEATPEEQMAQEATEQVASDAPAEPAVLQPAPAFETDPADQTANQSAAAPQEPAGASDPFARFNDSATEASASSDENGAAQAIPADPFAPAATSAESDSAVSEQQQNAPPSSSRPENRSSGASATPFSQTSELEYLVAPGDTLSDIATKIYGSQREWQTIAQVNSLRAPFVIFPGDVLKIQTFGAASSYAEAYQNVPEKLITVQKGETLSSISKRLLGNGSSWKYIWKINEAAIPNPNVLRPGQVIRFKDFRNVQVSL